MSDKLISFMVPSARSIDDVRKVVKLLFTKAKDPSRIEIIFRLDDDRDLPNYENEKAYRDLLLNGIEEKLHDNVITIFGERFFGYCSIGNYKEEMYRVANGEFVFSFNDDITDITEWYDEDIEKYSGKCVILNIDNARNEWDFYCISKKIVDITGTMQYSIYFNYDWMNFGEWFPNIRHRVGVEVQHTPGADFGLRAPHHPSKPNWNCRQLTENDYTWNCKHFDETGNHKKTRDQKNGLNKWIKMVYVDIVKLKNYLKSNSEYIYDIEENGPDKWENKEVEFRDEYVCGCCSFELKDIEKQVKESGFLD